MALRSDCKGVMGSLSWCVLNLISAEPEWKALSTIELKESCYATPAISNNRLYVRTDKSLICLGNAESGD